MTDLSHDATDDGFHEIQLSGKQLVFLFMATTVVSVVIFLCGVLVGRGVRSDLGTATTPPLSAAGPSVSTPNPAAAPPPVVDTTGATEKDLTYAKRLEGEHPAPEKLTPRQQVATPAPEEPKPAPSQPAAAKVETPKPAPVTTQPPASTKGSAQPGIWAVQVVALTDPAAANAVVQRLSSKGYPAFLVSPQSGAAVQNYKVQVGKFEDRSEAELDRRQAQEGRTVPALDSSLALLSGALLALSFPKYGHPACAWMALTPLLVALVRPGMPRTTRSAFRLGLLTGAGYFSGTLYWLVETMTTFGGLPTVVAVLVAGLLVAYLSLFPAAFAVAVARLRTTLGVRAAVLCAAPVWVASELGRQYVWDGFPWALLGYSQVSVLPIAQLASVTGVYGLSFLLGLTSAAAAMVILNADGRKRWTMAVVVLALVAGIAAWGRWRIAEASLTASGDAIRVAVVQGNIAQDEKWNPARRDDIISRYVSMTRQATAQGATFVIWPESSFPVYFEEDLRGHLVRRLARETGATLLVGSDQIERVRPDASPEALDNRLYNAAFLVKPDGSLGPVYRKMHLVPFGEYVPLQRLLFFVGPIVEAVSNFTPGERPVLLPVGDRLVSTAICYEVIYGSLMRRFVRDGSELLTTITNDAWYGWSSAAYQHWDQAAMRAIENGRYLARAANTGVSGFVDPYGQVLRKSKLFEQTVLVGDVRLSRTRTIYTRTGDLIAWVSLTFVAAALFASWRMKYNREV